MIYTRPLPEKQLSNFRMNEELMTVLPQLIETELKDISLLFIRADKGNGGSHLLNALANELRKKGIRLTFLQFREYDSLSDLSTYHFNDIIKDRFVFIDRIDLALRNTVEQDEVERFMKDLASNDCKLIATVSPQEEPIISRLTDSNGFGKRQTIDLFPLDKEQRINWCKELLETNNLDHLPADQFEANNSNTEFLESLKPFIQELKRRKGLDHSFMRTYSDQLNTIKLQIRKNQLEQAELEIEKAACIRMQHYEKAADLRTREKQLMAKKHDLWNKVKKMLDDLPFYPGLLDLHFKTITLLNELEVKNTALRTLNKRLNKHLAELENEWQKSKQTTESKNKSQLFNELKEWEYAVDRFNAQNTNRK
jgi:hypothetical protein